MRYKGITDPASSCRRICNYWVQQARKGSWRSGHLAGSLESDTVTVTRKSALRLPVAMSAIVVSGMALGGCMGSPTYGTDKTANQQLVEDLTGIL